jgi:hypothetical protein
MTDDAMSEAEYERYRSTLGEIVDGGGCMETTTAAADLREDRSADGPSKRDLLGSDALAAGVAESVDDVLEGVDAETARETLRADYDDIDDVRAALRETVDPALFEALAAAGVAVESVDAFALDPAVCLKTFGEADLPDALTLVPEIREGEVVARIVARTTAEGAVVTLHAVPEWDRSYAVIEREGGRALVLPDGTTADCADADRQETGLDCDPERAARTVYVQTVCSAGGTEYVIETVCTTV